MLINLEEIQNLAWLDSEYFDHQGFLLVKDHSNAEQVNYVERFVRLKGNVLFVLKPPILCYELSDLDKRSARQGNANRPISGGNAIDDEVLSNDDEFRIRLLISFYKKCQASSAETDRSLLFVLVLNSEFSVRRFDESTRNCCGFAIEFYSVTPDSQNVWVFNCLTAEARDSWIAAIHRANHVNLKSIFNLLLERKLKLIRRRSQVQASGNLDELKLEQLNSSTNSSSSDIHKSTSSNNLSAARSSGSLTNHTDQPTVESIDPTSDSQQPAAIKSVASSLSIISSASSAHSKESSLSNVSTATSLLTQNNLIHQTKDGLTSIFLTDSYFKRRNSFDKLAASYSFTLAVDLGDYRFSSFRPSIFVKVYCSLTNGRNWSALGRTETLEIANEPNSSAEETKFAKKFYLNLYEKIELQNNLQKIVKFDLENNKVLLKFNICNLIEPLTNRFVLIGTAIDHFKATSQSEIFSSVHYKPLQIGLLKMTSLENSELSTCLNGGTESRSGKNDEYSAVHSDKRQPAKSSPFEFGTLVEPQLFVNTIHRSFQFELPAVDGSGQASMIHIHELMAEPVQIYTLVQDLLNVFMDDEKKLMNCITYSLGEVRQEYQRRQMQMLESHLRLVNLVTESINSLNQVQMGAKFFRQSTQKNEVFFQFVPLNLHLQRSVYNKQSNRRAYPRRPSAMDTFDILSIHTHGSFSAHRLGFENGGLSKFINEIENSTKDTGTYFHLNKIWSTMRKYFKIINLQKRVSELNEKMIDLTLRLGQQTDLKLAKNSEFCDDFQKLKIDLIENEAAQQLLRDKIYCQKVILKLFARMEECCVKMTGILDPKQVESTLGYLDVFRAQQTFGGLEDEESDSDQNGDSEKEPMKKELKKEPTKESIKENAGKDNGKSSSKGNAKDNAKGRKKASKEQDNKTVTGSTMKSSMLSLINSSKSTLHSSFKLKSNQKSKAAGGSNAERTLPKTIPKTISCPLDQVQSSAEMMKKTEDQLRKLRRHNSENRIDDHLEFEPVELIHLNIRASLISMQSKLNQLVNFNLESFKQQKFNYSGLYEKIVNEMKPSTKKLFNSIESLVKTAQICYAIESLKLSKEQSEYFYLVRSRRNMVFSQVLTTFTLGLISELTCPKINRSEYLEDLHNLNSFNNNFSDLHDLGDLNDLSDFNDDSKYLNRLFEQRQIVCFFEGLLSCYADEIGMLQDMQHAIKELNSVQVLFVNLYYDAGQFKKYNLTSDSNLLNNGICKMPKFEGNGYNVQITIPFYDENLPEEFTCDIVALFFNIGINEGATLAETIGHVKLQDEINRESFWNLENFVSSHADIKSKQLINNLTALKTELYSSRAKNVRILQLSEQIAYDLNGIRFTNCKSGKDRTSMSCTLEQVRKAGQLFEFDEINQGKLFQQMLDTLRSEGVRRSNTTKNVGVPKYAFNAIRIMTLPKLYQPPSGTYGNYVQT